MSSGEGAGNEKQEYYRRRKVSSCTLRRTFLQDCLEEQVLPKCAPKQLSNGNNPFSDCARAYLQEACDQLTDQIDVLRGCGATTVLPRPLMEKLKIEEQTQRSRLARKLEELCQNSKWNTIGRTDLVRNLSGAQLSSLEVQALSLGLKFDSGVPKHGFTDLINKNYKWDEKDVDKGFKQGVITCYQALATREEHALPRRFRTALENIGKRRDIIITHADKGGGVVVMKKCDYINKMQELLNDDNTYKKVDAGYAEKQASEFKKKARKMLASTDRGKKLLGLLEEAPRPPRMRGLPKVHKPGIPMRPITSGIGSAPHRLAKRLAKPLSAALGRISGAHLRNSSELIDRVKDIDMTGKKMVSFDVKALFTNVPLDGAIETVKKVVQDISDDDLPVRKQDYINLVSLCVKFGCFTFNDQEYIQHRGLAMGSPLSAVMASLFMESLEKDKLMRIMGRGTHWFRYVDDILVIMPETTNVENKLRMLNNVNEHIQFTVEEEVDGVLPFLDTRIHRMNNTAKFSVYRKPTNKDDFIHFLSRNDMRTKTGTVIGFFLRAFRVCSEEYLEDECNYIMEAFKRLEYPPGMLYRLKSKAQEILRRTQGNESEGAEEKETNYVVVPYSRRAEPVTRLLSSVGVKVVHASGKKIKDTVSRGGNVREADNTRSVVYKIPCAECPSSYIGETSRGIKKREYEHKNDLRHHRTSNSLVLHAEDQGHLPDWENVQVLHSGMEKKTRKTIEAAYITTTKTTNHREGFVKLAVAAAELVLVRARRHRRTDQSARAIS